MYEITAGPMGPVHYPVPWAREPSISHLLPPYQLRELLQRLGFEVVEWRDKTTTALEFFDEVQARMAQSGPRPALGPHTFMGTEWPVMVGNMIRNFGEDRLTLVLAVMRKPLH